MPADKDEVFPGWGLPVNHMPEGNPVFLYFGQPRTRNNDCSDKPEPSLIRFKNAIQDWAGRAVPLREISMMDLMRELMEKPEWERKVCDEVIVEKWKAEALERFEFTVGMWDYVSPLCLYLCRGGLHGIMIGRSKTRVISAS